MIRFSSPSSYLVLLVLVGTSICITFTTDVISELESKFTSSQIVLFGQLDDRLLMLTSPQPLQLYSIPMTNIAHDSINLNGVKRVSMDEQWPGLSNSSLFENVLKPNSTHLSTVLTLQQQSTVMFGYEWTSDSTKVHLATVTYSIESVRANLTKYDITCPQCSALLDCIENVRFISSSLNNTFFGLSISSSKGYQLFKYRSEDGGFVVSCALFICPTGNSSNSSIVLKSGQICANHLDWGDIENGGFADQKYFRLFSHHQVVVFPYPFENDSATAVGPLDVKVFQLEQYFSNSGDDPDSRNDPNHRGKYRRGVIVCIILGLIVLVASIIATVVALHMCRDKSKDNNNQVGNESSSEPKKVGKQSTSQAPSKPMVRAKQSTKQSKGSFKAIKAKQVSKGNNQNLLKSTKKKKVKQQPQQNSTSSKKKGSLKSNKKKKNKIKQSSEKQSVSGSRKGSLKASHNSKARRTNTKGSFKVMSKGKVSRN